MDDLIRQRIISTVTETPGITLAELLDRVYGIHSAHVYELILTKQIYTDLCAAWLGDEDQVLLFIHQIEATFFTRLSEYELGRNDGSIHASDLLSGTKIMLDGNPLELINVGKTEVLLRDSDGNYPTIELHKFEMLLREGKVTNYRLRPQVNPATQSYELGARRHLNREQMLEALNKHEIVKRILAGEHVAVRDSEARKHRNWVASYKKAQAEWGNGLIGLMPKKRKGNIKDRLTLIHPNLRQMLVDFISTVVETPKKISKSIAYGQFRNLCKEQNINPPSRKTFNVEVKRRDDAQQVEKMEGSKAAYQQEEFIDDKYYTTPVHGDRPWEYAHLDHTEMDVKLRHSRIKKKKFRRKAWLTLLVDSCTRRTLASHKSFEKPSRVSCMMVIRDCVLRHGRLPDCIVVDGGSEFQSTYFEKLTARYNCDVQWRPPTKPRFGSIIERFIHTLNKQFLHNLLGNTKIMKRARQVTAAVDPDTHAIWTLPLLDEALDKYFYEEYDTREHSSLGQSPREAFDELMEKFNAPPPCKITYDQIFLIETMIPVRNGSLKVQRSRGVKVFGTWYKCREFRDPMVIETKVKVHIDPEDISHVYAYVKNRWIQCFAPPRVLALLRGKSLKMMRVISIEEHELSRSYGHAANHSFEELARRHASREETEAEEQQRLIDEESREITARKESLKLAKTENDHQRESEEENELDEEFEPEIYSDKVLTFKRARRG